MSTDPFFGAEVIDLDISGQTVQDLRSATCFLIGTAPIQDVHGTAEERAAYINKPILIRTREQAATAFGSDQAGYTIPSALDGIFDQAETKGVGTIVVVNVFDPDTHQTTGTPDPALVTNIDILGEFDAAGTPSGLKIAYDCYQRFGWFAKILIAPGFSNAIGVKAELEVIANRTRGRALLDAPIGLSVQSIIEARGPLGVFDWQSDSRRLIGAWPHMEVADTENAGEVKVVPYSPILAGVWLRTLVEQGYHHSPSNCPIYGIEGAHQPVTYIPGDASSDMQLLRSAGIVTTEERYGKGPHTSGNRSFAYPADSDMRNFLHALFIIDMMDEAVIHYLDDWKDRNASPATIEYIEQQINQYLAQKTVGEDPVLYAGRFSFNREKTTSQTVAQGQFYWTLEVAPIGIMERLTVERSIDLDLIRSALDLAA